MNTAEQLDYYNIQIEYETEPFMDYEENSCVCMPPTVIEIGLHIEQYDIHDRCLLLQELTHIITKIQCDDFSTRIEGDIFYIMLFLSYVNLNTHIKIIEEFVEYTERTDAEYLTSTIILKDTSF